MILKPQACQGCPAYTYGKYMVPDEIHEGAVVDIWGPSGVPSPRKGYNLGLTEQDEAEGRPFTGKEGWFLEHELLPQAGLTRERINLRNAIRCRWKGSNDLPDVRQTILRQALDFCGRAHGVARLPTRLSVAMGDYAAVYLTGESIGEWRGYMRSQPGTSAGRPELDEPWVPQAGEVPILLSHHPTRLFREPSLTMAAKADWNKVARFLNGKWPRKPPRYLTGPVREWPTEFSFDTEYDPASNHLIRYSLAWGTEDDQSTVVERRDHRIPRPSPTRPRVVSQYTPADMAHLDRLSGGRGDGLGKEFWDTFLIEDSVWKHSTLWSDQEHGLNYLASIYSSFNRWKHLSGSNPELYSALDAIGLHEVDRSLEQELDCDPKSRKVWEWIDRPALGEFVRAQYRGLLTDQARVSQVISQLGETARQATLKAQALVGWPINLGSNPQVGHQLYIIEGIKTPRG